MKGKKNIRSSFPKELLVSDRVAVVHSTSVCISAKVLVVQNVSIWSVNLLDMCW